MRSRALPLVVPLLLLLAPPRGCALSRHDLYTHGQGLDAQLAPSDDSSSEELHLKVPVVFYGQQYSSLYVNVNGLISFRTDIPDFLNIEFPLEYPVIAPFYSNVDTRGTGNVFYRETQDAYIIAKATEDIQKFFPQQNFQPASVFIATWTDVGYHSQGSDKSNTYQVVIISNGYESYAEFLYPEEGIQWIQGIPQPNGLPDARAQVGFIGEDGRYFLLQNSGTDQIIKITHSSNTGRKGIFAYRIGNINNNANIEEPVKDRSREDLQNIASTCATGGSHQCHTKAQCVDSERGFCCVCLPEYYGNGKACLKNDVPLRVNGKISGEINGELLESMNLQAYVVMSDGRSYTALSKVPDRFGYDIQTLNIIGGVIGWLFAKPIGDSKNGYQLTGGVFNHTAEILFHSSGHKVTVRQYFTGLDLFDQLRMEAEIKGSIPEIPPGTKLEISDYEEQYSSSHPGTIISRSSRSFKNRGLLIDYPFTIDQSLSYVVCPFSPPEDLAPPTYTLKVAKNFLGYESREQIMRFGMSNKVTPLGQEDPCIKGRETCVEQSSCIVENDNFKCVCNLGYQYIYPPNSSPLCVDINECSTGIHTCDVNAHCINQEGSFSCMCNSGFRGNGATCEKVSVCENHRCDPSAQCYESHGSPFCHCNDGFTGDGNRCWPISDAGCEVLHNCSPLAKCIKSEYIGSFICQCLEGYSGDGYTCNVENIENTTEYVDENLFDTTTMPNLEEVNENTDLSCNVVNRCHPYAQCVYVQHSGNYQCQCTAGYEGNGIECTQEEISCEEVDICDAHAICSYDPGVSKSICICNPGYTGDGNICHSIADCSSSADCEQNAECTELEGSLRCVCIHGYIKDAQDACVLEAGTCSGATCAKHATCKWDSDYEVDYCECDSGYQGNGLDTCELLSKGCNVVNDCGLNAYCALDRQTEMYKCACNVGFYGDGYECTSESTCQYNQQFCSPQANCVERNSQYVCECNAGYIGDGRSCEKAPKHEGNFLLLNQGMATLRVPFEPTSHDPGRPIHISYMQMAIGLDIDCKEGKVYWSDISGRMIKSSSYDGSSINSFLTGGIISPEGISIDWVSRNIFWTDSRRDTIEVANLETKVRKVLFNTSLVDPRGIAVHPYKGKIFWSDWNRDSPKIEWANMDGTGRGIFLSGDSVHLPNSLAIDFNTDDLCYADAGTKSIECVQIDTLDKHTVATNCSYPFGLTVTDDRYYWTDWTSQKIEGLDKRTNRRLNPLDVPLGSGSGNKLYGIAAVPEQCRPLSNICQYDNGQCPVGHLCLLDGKGGRRCVCGKGTSDPPLC